MQSVDSKQSALVPVPVAVVTVSDTRTLADDTSGTYVAEALTKQGHRIVRRDVVKDDLWSLRALFASHVASPEIRVVIATGGTGITARDVTPEALEPLISKRIDGFGELFRALSYPEIGASTIQSRCVGALCHQTLVFLLPGSTGAVRLAMEKILLPQLDSRTRPCNFVSLFDRV